jgi:stringent starvation protein B
MSARARSIVNVDDDDWNLFAGLARLANIPLGEYLGVLARQEAERVGLKLPRSQAERTEEEDDKG